MGFSFILETFLTVTYSQHCIYLKLLYSQETTDQSNIHIQKFIKAIFKLNINPQKETEAYSD